MEPNITPALIAVLGSIGVGLIGIAGAMFMRIFKSPLQQNEDLTRALTKVADKVEKNMEDHGELAMSVAVLSHQVGTLSDNVKTLGVKVENIWLGNRSGREGWGG